MKSYSSLNELSLDLETRYTLCGQVSITNYVFYAMQQRICYFFSGVLSRSWKNFAHIERICSLCALSTRGIWPLTSLLKLISLGSKSINKRLLLCYSDLAQQMCKNAKEIRIKTKHCFCNGFSQDKSAFPVGMWYSQVFMEMQLLCSVMYQRMARSSFIKVTLVVLSCSFL